MATKHEEYKKRGQDYAQPCKPQKDALFSRGLLFRSSGQRAGRLLKDETAIKWASIMPIKNLHRNQLRATGYAEYKKLINYQAFNFQKQSALEMYQLSLREKQEK